MRRRTLMQMGVAGVAVGALTLVTLHPGASAAPTLTQAAPVTTEDEHGPVDPVYRLRLSSDGDGERWSGRQRVSFRNGGSTRMRTVWLRLWGNGEGGCEAPGAVVSAVRGAEPGPAAQDCTALPLELDRAVPPGGRASVAFDVAIDPPERADRFGTTDGFSFMGNAVPLLAVRDERGWQLPPYVAAAESFYSLTADFDVRLTHPRDLGVASGGRVVAVEQHGQQVTKHVRAKQARDFVWAAGPFERTVTETASGTVVRTWTTTGVTEQQRRLVTDSVVRGMETFSQDYRPYHESELDVVVASFEGFSGMEYPGLIMSEPDEVTAMHEVAHQWWYSLVGNDQYHHPWVDEALTHYSATRLTGVPPYCPFAPFWFSDTMRVDAGMDYYATRRDEYAPGVYGDGACMFHELEGMLGLDAVNAALAEYAHRYAYGIARPADLRDALQRHSPTDLTAFWERWRNTAH